MHDALFTRLAKWTAQQCGSASTFIIAIVVVLVWGITGPIFQWSDTWQLIINSVTNVVTFLMVFLIQNTQNRDTQAVQLKLDELLRVSRAARDELLSLEELSDQEVEAFRGKLMALAQHREERKAAGAKRPRSTEVAGLAGGEERAAIPSSHDRVRAARRTP